MAEVAATETRVRSHATVVTGCLPRIRSITVEEWADHYLPVVKQLLRRSAVRRAAGAVGKWTAELKTNDLHLHQFFTRNLERIPRTTTCDVNCYAFTRISDDETLWALRGLETQGEREAFVRGSVQEWSSPALRSLVRDPRLRDVAQLPRAEQAEVVLRAPFAIYCPRLGVYVTVNTDYYGEVKDHGVLGVLEEALVQAALLDGVGMVANPDQVWAGLRGAGVEYSTASSVRRGIVILSATSRLPIEYALDLLSVRAESRFHSVDGVFVNVATGRVLASAQAPYVPASLIPLWLGAKDRAFLGVVENGPAELESISVPDEAASPEEASDAFRRALALAVSAPESRVLVEPERMLGYERCSLLFDLTDLFVVVSDEASENLVESLAPDEFVTLVSGAGRCSERGDDDMPSPGPIFNPLLLRTGLCRGSENAVDQKRLACLRHLAGLRGVTASRVNLRFGDAFNRFLLRLAAEWSPLNARLVSDNAITHELCAKLRLVRKPVPGRDPAQGAPCLAGFTLGGVEATIVSLSSPRRGVLYLAVALRPDGSPVLLSYSRGEAARWMADFRGVDGEHLLETAAAGAR